MKYKVIYFVLWILTSWAIIWLVSALEIETSLENTLIYIKKIVLTDDGTPNGNTKVVIDGTQGNLSISGDLKVGWNVVLKEKVIDWYEIADETITKDKIAENSIWASELIENENYTINWLRIRWDGGLELESENDEYSYIDFKGKDNLIQDYRSRILFNDNFWRIDFIFPTNFFFRTTWYKYIIWSNYDGELMVYQWMNVHWDLNMSYNKIVRLADPTNDYDAVNKRYLENYVASNSIRLEYIVCNTVFESSRISSCTASCPNWYKVIWWWCESLDSWWQVFVSKPTSDGRWWICKIAEDIKYERYYKRWKWYAICIKY